MCVQVPLPSEVYFGLGVVQLVSEAASLKAQMTMTGHRFSVVTYQIQRDWALCGSRGCLVPALGSGAAGCCDR